MKSKLAIIAVSTLLAAGSAFATVSLNFNAEFDTGVPANLSNSLGVPTNGLIWGVLIDGSNNGISSVAYDRPAAGLTLGANYVLNVGGVATDDVLWVATALTSNTAGSTEGDGVTGGGNGGIYDLNGIALANGVSTGDAFYVVWFDGNAGGVLGDASFTIPADGALLSYGEPFVGNDPSRNAGLRYQGTSAVSTGPGVAFAPIPEPSAALLGVIGALGLLRRRRA